MEIKDYPGYFIHRDGRVWSDKLCRGVKGRFLKHIDDKGYKIVNLCKDGKTKNKFIHQLIAIHYIPNPNNFKDIDHINQIKYDNRIENLRWCNHTMNMNNMSVKKNNKCGIKNISCDSRRQQEWWCFSKTYMGKLHRKHFKTMEEAIKYKESYLKSLNLEVL